MLIVIVYNKTRPMDILKYLALTNTWWDGKTMPEEHGFPHKRLLFSQFERLAMQETYRRSLVMLGPRRVGKTFMLKQLIGQAIATNKFNPKNICYADMDDSGMRRLSPTDVVQLFKTKTAGNKPCLVILDEIQSCEDWQRHIKFLTDHEKTVRFVVSGSIASALKRKSSESGFGRFLHFSLPPILFGEFLRLKNIWPGSLPFSSAEINSQRLSKAEIKNLNKHFLDYLDHGGYPETTFNGDSALELRASLNVLNEELFGKYAVEYGISSNNLLYPLLERIAAHVGEEVSLQALSNSTGVSINTLYKYLEFLQSAYLIRRIEKYSSSMNIMQRHSPVKYVLENPSMISHLLGENDDPTGHVIEAATISQYQVISNLSKNRFTSPIRYCKFKRNKKEYEVDMVHTNSKGNITRLAEIKWTDNPNYLGKGAANLRYFANKLGATNELTGVFCTTRSTYNDKNAGDVTFLPTAQYCLSLSVESLEENE